MIQQKIKQLAQAYAPDYINVRHHLHANPELSYQEFETSKYIQEHLKRYNIPFEVKATTGVIGIIEGRNPQSRIVALRADMDALPITEENDVPYKSTKPGIMHACGHDVHTTCLLGAARILSETRNDWEGTVKLIFQPGEEKNPGGASLLINEGVLENPKPQCIFGLHVNPQLETGLLSFRGGKIMASADELYITIKSKGGHAAAPHLTADTILIASHLIVSLQQVISRNNNPLSPSVLSITSIQGGHTTNVIPTEVKLMGTFRAMDEEWRFKAHELIRRQTEFLVKAMGGEADLHIDVGYPTVYNHEGLHEYAKQIAKDYMGEEKVEETEVRMGAEDFGFYSQAIPGCFYRLGTANKAQGITSGVHTPRFNIDESAIEIGIGMMATFGATANFQ
ncbi:M20 metallopeptidase family protein [Flavisolibacter tropicus]|uniref:N-acyl-L-amino acid amidohydrolase n=1 Tax=Flavisolibacter tropicus TaxID=1492898 RepID=A0A172U301_9BACT|nr:M20 family metallopeptidase [Flavisolibacter tropicus]ANE53367.1 N-acyl-L-amino acid amidohydrolase [Flavisolibacter tropicus]